MRNEQYSHKDNQKLLARYIMIVLVATLLINCLSAYIRHIEAGLGCEDWPSCYGEIGRFISPSNEAEIAQKALAPTEVAKQLHRTIATLLVIGVLLLVNQSRKPGAMEGMTRPLPYLLLAVLLLLSIIGPASYLKTMPIIAVLNLAGGLALLAICWWLWLQCKGSHRTVVPAWTKRLTMAGWVLLMFQILLGSWVSANYAGLACSELLSCHAPTSYSTEGSDTFWYFRQLALDSEGRVLFDASSVIIHKAHRAMALLSGLILLIGALSSLQYRKKMAIGLALLVLVQLLLGSSGIVLSLPMVTVMAHNLIAAFLLMAVMALNYQLVQAK